MKRQSGFLARPPSLPRAGQPFERGGRRSHPESRSCERTFMRRADRSRRSRALLPYSLFSSPPSVFRAGPGTLPFSHNCHPTQSLVLRDVQGLPFVSPDTRCPPPPPPLPFTFVSLVAFSRRATVLVSPTRFLPRGPDPSSPPPRRLSPCRAAYSFRLCDRPARSYTGWNVRAGEAEFSLLRALCSRRFRAYQASVPKARDPAALGRFNSDE